MRFPTMWYVRPAKPQISLRICLTGGCRGPSESTLVKMSNCWKSHAAAQINTEITQLTKGPGGVHQKWVQVDLGTS